MCGRCIYSGRMFDVSMYVHHKYLRYFFSLVFQAKEFGRLVTTQQSPVLSTPGGVHQVVVATLTTDIKMESRLSKRWTHNGRSREHEHDTGLRQRMSKMNLNDSTPENEPMQDFGKDFLNGKPRTNIRSDQPNTSANNGRTIASNHSSNTKTSDAETMIIVLNEFELTDEDEEVNRLVYFMCTFLRVYLSLTL